MSFIVVPPTLDQTVMPLPTPSQEWTENTSALRSTPEDETGHTGTTAPPMARNPSGPTFPGGYNFTDDLESTATQRGSDTTLASTTTSVIDTAKQYIPQGAQQAFLNAGQTAKAYLPASVGAYIRTCIILCRPSIELIRNSMQLGRARATLCPWMRPFQVKRLQVHSRASILQALEPYLDP
jgi:hypothetical protein